MLLLQRTDVHVTLFLNGVNNIVNYRARFFYLIIVIIIFFSNSYTNKACKIIKAKTKHCKVLRQTLRTR